MSVAENFCKKSSQAAGYEVRQYTKGEDALNRSNFNDKMTRCPILRLRGLPFTADDAAITNTFFEGYRVEGLHLLQRGGWYFVPVMS
jgi:hypothetical protein